MLSQELYNRIRFDSCFRPILFTGFTGFSLYIDIRQVNYQVIRIYFSPFYLKADFLQVLLNEAYQLVSRHMIS